MKAKLNDLNVKIEAQSINLELVQKEKISLEKKLLQTTTKLLNCQSDLSEERIISNALKRNQKEWQTKLTNLEVINNIIYK